LLSELLLSEKKNNEELPMPVTHIHNDGAAKKMFLVDENNDFTHVINNAEGDRNGNTGVFIFLITSDLPWLCTDSMLLKILMCFFSILRMLYAFKPSS
jgi:hypothetical protein